MAITSDHTSTVPSPPCDCAGLVVVWPQDLRPFAMVFPWERYHEGPDSVPFLVDLTTPSKPQLRSKRCKLSSPLVDVPCDECADISQHVNHLADAARNP
ncbi:hypothetical protein P692DRAFT_20880950 [Suillus brevipes Sb2]|nr:hypothetical protein P692DRAFT_20880950 [Suillus brevipes Sb2]